MPETDANVFKRFVILMSHERSGSHYLADMLTSTSDVQSFDEVCNFNAINPDTSPASFFRFRRQAQTTDPDIALRPGTEPNTRLVDGYLAHLSRLAKGAKRLLIDVKYGHVHNFEIGWWPTERRPFFLSYLERKDVGIVHLTRRDSLAAVVSAQIADKRGVWHRKDGEEQAADKIKIAAMKAVQEALALEREKENFFGWLAGNTCFHIEYEQLAGDAPERNTAMRQLCAFLGIAAPQEFRSAHRKITPPLHKTVENYDELQRIARMFGGGKLKSG